MARDMLWNLDEGVKMAFNSQKEQYEERIKELECENKELADNNEDLKLEIKVFTETIQAFKEIDIRQRIARLLLAE